MSANQGSAPSFINYQTMHIFLKHTKYKYSIKLYVFNSNIADDGNPETPSPLESANVVNFDPKNGQRPLWTIPYT